MSADVRSWSAVSRYGRRIKGWRGSRLWRSARFYTAADLSHLLEDAGVKVDTARGAVYNPPVGMLARATTPLEEWLGSMTTVGAAFNASPQPRSESGKCVRTV